MPDSACSTSELSTSLRIDPSATAASTSPRRARDTRPDVSENKVELVVISRRRLVARPRLVAM